MQFTTTKESNYKVQTRNIKTMRKSIMQNLDINSLETVRNTLKANDVKFTIRYRGPRDYKRVTYNIAECLKRDAVAFSVYLK